MNDESGRPYPGWQDPLHQMICELNLEKFAKKAIEVEALIVERLRQLQQSNHGPNERAAISYGLSILRMIKRDRLGHPDWRKTPWFL